MTSTVLDVLQMKEEDVLKLLAAGTHLGGTNLEFQVEHFIYQRKNDGIYIINLKRTQEKLPLAVHAIVAMKKLVDVSVILQGYWPAASAEVCCCHWNDSCCLVLHSWNLP